MIQGNGSEAARQDAGDRFGAETSAVNSASLPGHRAPLAFAAAALALLAGILIGKFIL